MRLGASEVESIGSGPSVVLIHGFPLDSRMWRAQRPLADAFRLTFVDLRGHGTSPYHGDAEHSMETFAEDVADVVSVFGGQAHIVGLSMGGYVALALLESHPELFLSLALVDTKAGADTEEGRAARLAAAESVIGNGRGSLFEGMVPKLVAPDASLGVRASLRTMIEDQPVETIVADQFGMAKRPDRHHVLESIDFPAAVIVGEYDLLAPVTDAEKMVGLISQGRLVVVPNAGHLSPMENPAAVNHALRDLWMSSGL